MSFSEPSSASVNDILKDELQSVFGESQEKNSSQANV